MFPYTISEKAITVFVNGNPRTFSSTHGSFGELREAVLAGDEQRVIELSDVKASVAQKTFGRVEILDNEIRVDGRVVTGRLIDRILEMVRLGSAAIGGYVAFLDNLMNNPRESAVNELYEFIEASNLPITPDGCFLAYRYVGDDWKDMHSRSVFQKPADLMSDAELEMYSEGVIGGQRGEVTTKVVDGVTTISMPRNMVDDVRTNTCSRGLHFCSISYLPSYGTGRHVLVVKINPAHVVSIPEEYRLNKGRTEAYQVVGTINHEEREITPWFTDEYEPELDEDFDDEEYDGDFDDIPLSDVEPVDFMGTPLVADDEADYGQKLTWDGVRQMRKVFAAMERGENDCTLSDVATAYGISRRQAARIRDFESWVE